MCSSLHAGTRLQCAVSTGAPWHVIEEVCRACMSSQSWQLAGLLDLLGT